MGVLQVGIGEAKFMALLQWYVLHLLPQPTRIAEALGVDFFSRGNCPMACFLLNQDKYPDLCPLPLSPCARLSTPSRFATIAGVFWRVAVTEAPTS